jgi:hypothetical protein
MATERLPSVSFPPGLLNELVRLGSQLDSAASVMDMDEPMDELPGPGAAAPANHMHDMGDLEQMPSQPAAAIPMPLTNGGPHMVQKQSTRTPSPNGDCPPNALTALRAQSASSNPQSPSLGNGAISPADAPMWGRYSRSNSQSQSRPSSPIYALNELDTDVTIDGSVLSNLVPAELLSRVYTIVERGSMSLRNLGVDWSGGWNGMGWDARSGCVAWLTARRTCMGTIWGQNVRKHRTKWQGIWVVLTSIQTTDNLILPRRGPCSRPRPPDREGQDICQAAKGALRPRGRPPQRRPLIRPGRVCGPCHWLVDTIFFLLHDVSSVSVSTAAQFEI